MLSRLYIAAIALLAGTALGAAQAGAQCGDPMLTCIDDIVVTGCDPGGAIVNYDPPTAADECGPVPLFLFRGLASGATFPYGTTDVEWATALDENGSYRSCFFRVTVLDATASIMCLEDITVVACGPDGGIVHYEAPTATSECGPVPLSLFRGLPSGATFPYGTTEVEWWTGPYSDGTYQSCYFRVTVDESPIYIDCLDDIVVAGCGPDGAVVHYETPTATNDCGPVALSLFRGLPSGSTFPYGRTDVEWWTPLDSQGSYRSCYFTVTVLPDTLPPVLTCPEAVTVIAPDGEDSAIVEHDIIVEGECADVTLEFDPPNGSALPCGTTSVNVTARDVAGNESTCTFDVTVGIAVPVDVKPGLCPNLYNLESSGNVAVAILGWSGLDPSRIDPSSVRLEGVAPVRWSLKDVGAPYLPFGGKDDCGDCAALRKDRVTDLDFTFRGSELRQVLDGALPGECHVLRLTGMTVDGCPIVGEDVVEIQRTGRLDVPGSDPDALAPITALQGASPNPLASATEIRFTLASPAPASLVIYDVAGRRVRTLADGWQPAGSHTATWDGRDEQGAEVANGLYLYVLNVHDGSTPRQVRKLIVGR